jgi:hypothetical protein
MRNKFYPKFMSLKKTYIYLTLPGILLGLLIYPVISHAQITDEIPKWSVGIGGGVLTGSIPTGGSASNVVSDRFIMDENFYPSFRAQAGYQLTDFESIELNVTSGSFSVFTDYEFWPDLLFENQFYTGTLSTRFRLKRVFQSLPDLLDLYGVFGLGLMQSNHNVTPNGTTGTSQLVLENDKSTDLSLLFSFGAGLDIPLSKNFAIFLEVDYKTMNRDLIDKKLAGEILSNDFIQTTSNWSTFSTGIRIRFGKSRSTLPPVDPDFELSASLLNETDQPVTIEEIEQEPEVEPEGIIIPKTVPVEIAEESTDEEPEVSEKTVEDSKDEEPGVPEETAEELTDEKPGIPIEKTGEIEEIAAVETDTTIEEKMGHQKEDEMIIPIPEPTQDLVYPESASDLGSLEFFGMRFLKDLPSLYIHLQIRSWRNQL